jgi:hypothetical protein
MAAAGLGNAVADVVGINISHSIEVRRPWGQGGAGWGGPGMANTVAGVTGINMPHFVGVRRIWG